LYFYIIHVRCKNDIWRIFEHVAFVRLNFLIARLIAIKIFNRSAALILMEIEPALRVLETGPRSSAKGAVGTKWNKS